MPSNNTFCKSSQNFWLCRHQVLLCAIRRVLNLQHMPASTALKTCISCLLGYEGFMQADAGWLRCSLMEGSSGSRELFRNLSGQLQSSKWARGDSQWTNAALQPELSLYAAACHVLHTVHKHQKAGFALRKRIGASLQCT